MKEKTLLKIALIISILGLLLLVILSQLIKIGESPIAKITKEKLEEDVKLTGKIIKISETNNTIFLQIQSQDRIAVIVFKNRDVDLRQNDIVEIEGTVEDYQGNLEIIANKVRVIGWIKTFIYQ